MDTSNYFLQKGAREDMVKKMQVFVSSTYTDLIEERQKAVEAILDAGHIPAGMELFRAGKSQMETIQKWIDESDVYCLILGGRYGSVKEESKLSYTQLEYEYAVSKGKPLFAIVLDDSMVYQKAAEHPKEKFFEEGENKARYEQFKKEVGKSIYKVAYNASDIVACIHAELNAILNSQPANLAGWVKGTKGVSKAPAGADSALSDVQRKLMEADKKIRAMPQDPYAYMERAELLAPKNSKNLRNILWKAIPDYLYAIFLNPEFSQAYYSMIQKLTIAGDHSRALRFAEEACGRFPNEGNAYGCRAYVKCAKKLYQEGIEDCNKAISLLSNRWFYNTRGRCYRGMNQLDRALEDFVLANRLDPDYEPAIENASSVARRIGISNLIDSALEEKEKGNFGKAKIYLECVMLADPANERGLQEHGGLYYDMGKFPEALGFWKRSLGVHKSCKNYYLCAAAYHGLNERSLAKEFCLSALEYPDDGYYRLVKAMLETLEK